MENIEDLVIPGFDSSTKTHVHSPVHLGGAAMVGILLGFLSGYIIAKKLNLRDAFAAKAVESSAGPFVETAQAELSSPDRVIKELAEALPFASVTLYAKVSGYLKQILVDKGDRVKQGQLLATIYSPETSSEYASAAADKHNKELLANRARALFSGGDVTEEERDKAVAAADMAAARLAEISAKKDYTELLAPFDGMVTERFVDPGALVQDAAKAETGALPIVTVATTEKLRVTTYIDQRDASYVRVGDPALITMPENPRISLEATVSRKAGEFDLRSRTMRVEVDLDNPTDAIPPGSFVDLALRVKAPQTVQVPSAALAVEGQDSFLAIIDKDDKIHYRKVEAGANDGTMVEILSGLKEGETVALNVGKTLLEGEHVQIENQE